MGHSSRASKVLPIPAQHVRSTVKVALEKQPQLQPTSYRSRGSPMIQVPPIYSGGFGRILACSSLCSVLCVLTLREKQPAAPLMTRFGTGTWLWSTPHVITSARESHTTFIPVEPVMLLRRCSCVAFVCAHIRPSGSSFHLFTRFCSQLSRSLAMRRYAHPSV